MRLVSKIKKVLLGSAYEAKKEGMIVEEGVSIVGEANFGSEPYLIHLHRNCRISMRVTFINHDGATWAFRNDCPQYAHVIKFGKIEVGEYSFVGANSTIMPGVVIGDHCVIGAGSLVTKSVPSGTVYAGVPAKFICTTEQYAEKCLRNMPGDYDKKLYVKDKKKYLIEHYMK